MVAAQVDTVPNGVDRKRRGAWYTPPELVSIVVERIVADLPPGLRTIRVLDPACGDGRFLVAVADRLRAEGRRFELTGCDVDAGALAAVPDRTARLIHGDALRRDWGAERFDLVVGNPPFLSQMAATTTRGGASHHGGGPYADAAVEFLALAVRLADPERGRVGLVLPQSILASRDAGPVRELVGRSADLAWSWWEPGQQHFDAAVNVCALGFRRPATGALSDRRWTGVVTDALGVPPLDVESLATDGTVGDRALLNANFRDEYYALVPAVSDDVDGPPLVTSGLIDPGVCLWGRRPVRFAKQEFAHPRVDLSRLHGRFSTWARRKLVPKVLVANQTRMVEAVADPDGEWLPGVPVTTVTPADPHDVWRVAAVLTSPVASALAWHQGAGTGLSSRAVRVGPAPLAALPWPAGSLDAAVTALRDSDVGACGELVTEAFGCADPSVLSWWKDRVPNN